ncbi:MAG: transporter substrate-binding domain-containing protein [Pseudomonadales bacterium]
MPSIEACIEAMRDAMPAPDAGVIAALAPTGRLRAGINLSNFLLVASGPDAMPPVGVSPGMASALATMLGVEVEYVGFASPGAVADAAQDNVWDIGNIGAEPARAEYIRFTNAYCEIEATCLLRGDSPIEAFDAVDRPGVRIATKNRAAFTLWLERNLKHAELVLFDSPDAAFEGFMEQSLEVLAGLRPRLLDDVKRLPGARLLPEKFTAIQQAIGTPSDRDPMGSEYLERFADCALTTGLVDALIEAHQVTGKLSAAY